MSKQTFSIHGTHCKSCEVVVERELRRQPDVQSVTVSHSKQQLQIQTHGNKTYAPEELSTLLQAHGYRIDRASSKSATPSKINWQRIAAFAVLVIGLYLLLDRLGLLRLSPSVANPAGYIGVLMIGLVASLSSCTAVVGGLVAAVGSSVAKGQPSLTTKQKLRPHLLFNLGRVSGFFVLGALIGLIGSGLALSPAVNGIVILLVAVLMLVIGVNLLELFPAPIIGMPKWIAHKVHDVAESKNPAAPMLLGALTFFLPCGFTQSMQLFAITLQNPLQAGVVMAVFALGTTPALLGIGSATAFTSGTMLKHVTRVAGVLVLILAISNLQNGAALLGYTPRVNTSTSNNAITAPIQNSRQIVQMEVTPYGFYSPDVLVVQEDVPVDWQIFGADSLGCADTLILPAFGIQARIQPGLNQLTFTPTKPGRFVFSCSMGMVRGTLIVQPST